MREMTIREVLLGECMWPRKFLSPSGEIARFDRGEFLGKKTCGFVPFGRWQRIFNPGSFLPVDRVLPIGCQIRFDQRLSGNHEFTGLVEPTAGSQFPFGEWLITSNSLEYTVLLGSGHYFVINLGKNFWTCSSLVLTFLHDVSIRSRAFD